MIRIRGSAVLAGLLSSQLVLLACSPPSSTSSDGGGKDEVTVGLLAPMTGPAAADGEQMKRGAELAIKEANESGGVDGHTFKLQVEDVQDQRSDAVSSAVSKLTSDPDVGGVVTGYASTSNFEIDQMAEAEIPYILSAGADQTEKIIGDDPEGYPTVWSFVPSYSAFSTDLPARLDEWDSDGTFPLRNRKAYLISSDNPYSNSIATGLEKNLEDRGWDVEGPDTVPFGEVNDWTTQISAIRDLDPDLVVSTDYLNTNAVRFLEQFRQNPTRSLVFIQYAPSTPDFLGLAGSNADGVVYSVIGTPIPSKKNTAGNELKEKFKKEYDAELGSYGAFLYEEVRAYLGAVDKVGDPWDKAAVGEAIGDLELETSAGTVSFDPETHLARSGEDGQPIQFFQIQDGTRVLIDPDEYATGKFVNPPWFS